MPAKLETTLLDAVTSTGAGSGVDALEYNCFAFFINAASVTTGGTVKIQGLTPANDWVDINETTVSADGDTLVQKDGAYLQVRANLTARTDGTFTVSMVAKEGKINESVAAAESIVSTTGLVSFWKLDEASGSRADSHGSNTLTDNNTVGQGASITAAPYSTAADMVAANSEFLSDTDNAELSTGDVNFCFSFWVKFDSVSQNQPVLCKAVSPWSATNEEYRLLLLSSGTLRWRVSDGVSAAGTVNSSASFSAGSWYHVYCWHDSVGNEVGIRIDDTTEDTTSYSAGGQDTAGEFWVGKEGYVPTYADCQIQALAYWKGSLKTSAEITALADKDHPFYNQF